MTKVFYPKEVCFRLVLLSFCVSIRTNFRASGVYRIYGKWRTLNIVRHGNTVHGNPSHTNVFIQNCNYILKYRNSLHFVNICNNICSIRIFYQIHSTRQVFLLIEISKVEGIFAIFS